VTSTHIASDVDSIAQRVIVLESGRILFDGPPAEMLKTAPPVWSAVGEGKLIAAVGSFGVVTEVTGREDGRFRVRWVGESAGVGEEPVAATISDAYMAMTSGGVLA
jgi:ABC-type uncharacterized transport system ATPase subunit